MTRFQYFPHEVNTRNTSEVISLIEKEGMTGYGVYWAILEYLRAQDNYIGDLRVLSSMARYFENIQSPIGENHQQLRPFRHRRHQILLSQTDRIDGAAGKQTQGHEMELR